MSGELLLLGAAAAAIAVALSRTVGPVQHRAVRLTFARDADEQQLLAAVRALTGLRGRGMLGAAQPVYFEIVATSEGIEHFVLVPGVRGEFVIEALRAALPGLRAEGVDDRVVERPGLARELHRVGIGRLRDDVSASASALVIAALQPLRDGERVVVQYAVRPAGFDLLRWIQSVYNYSSKTPSSTNKPGSTFSNIEPAFAGVVRVGVIGQPARRVHLIARALGAFQPLGNDTARLRRRFVPSCLVARRMVFLSPPTGSRVDAAEAAALLAAPLGGPQLPGLSLNTAREIAAHAAIPRTGLVLGDSTLDPARPVAVSVSEAMRGTHLIGPTGTGKSTALVNLATQAMEAGLGLVLIDAKADLARDVLDRVPERRVPETLIFDPADPTPVGWNVIGGSEESELVVDHFIGELRARHGAGGLGPRSEDVLRASLATLTRQPGYTLLEVEALLSNPAFRQRLIGDLDDPVLSSFWAWFGSLSEAARGEVVGPLRNKVRGMTMRPRVRTIIGRPDGLDLAAVLRDGRVLIVSLASGVIGPDAAALIGASITSRLWTAIQGRAAQSASERRPVLVVCDEFQSFAALSPAFGDAVAQSRGYGVGWVLAHQHRHQLDADTRHSVMANCRSRVSFALPAEDAAAIARELSPHLESADLMGLPAYEAYAQVSTGAAVAPPTRIRTRPAPPPLDTAERIRKATRERFGKTLAEVDAAHRQRVGGRQAQAPVGGRRRR